MVTDEIKRVRIWDAKANADWRASKAAILKPQKPFDPMVHDNKEGVGIQFPFYAEGV